MHATDRSAGFGEARKSRVDDANNVFLQENLQTREHLEGSVGMAVAERAFQECNPEVTYGYDSRNRPDRGEKAR
jgi:hypothetical protein